MAGLWSVIIPETSAVQNYVTNPSFETNTTGWNAGTGTLTAVATYQRRGYKSMSYLCDTAVGDGCFFDSVALPVGTASYTFAFDFYGSSGVPFEAHYASTAGDTTGYGVPLTWTGTGDWQRLSTTQTFVLAVPTNVNLYIVKNNSETAAQFYVDGAGVYQLDHDPGHIDGDQPDCVWLGTAHASKSQRDAGSREGGEETNFDDFSFYISEWPGAGMAEVEPLLQQIGRLPGAIFSDEKIRERSFSLVGTLIGTSQANLHARRKTLIDALKSDRVKDKQEVILTYSGSNSYRKMRAKVRYVNGLTFGPQRGFSENIALQFLATDPFWYEDGNAGASLNKTTTIDDVNYMIGRVDGSWIKMTSSTAIFGSSVLAITADKSLVKTSHTGIDYSYSNTIYIGGGFHSADGTTNGDHICSWSDSALSALSSGVDGVVYALCPSPSGNLIAGGIFAAAYNASTAVANTNKIALWNGSEWSAIGTAFAAASADEYIKTIAVDNSGNIYAGGSFINIVDGSGDYISCYSVTAAAWVSMVNGLDGICDALAIGPDGYLYAGGAFTAAGIIDGTNGIARWNGTAWSALSTTGIAGGAADVFAICFDNAGRIYIGGDFTTVNGLTVNNIAMFDGSKWNKLGEGISGTVYSLSFNNGLLYIGSYATAGGFIDNSLLVWNGSDYAHLPIKTTLTLTINSIYTQYEDDLFITLGAAGTFNTSYLNSITNNSTSITYPKFVFTRSGGTSAYLSYIKNRTTGATLWLDYYLLDGEKITIDTALNKHTIISSYRGNVVGSALLRNSDFSSFYLLPGTNSLEIYVSEVGSPTVTAYATWPLASWSLDGSAT